MQSGGNNSASAAAGKTKMEQLKKLPFFDEKDVEDKGKSMLLQTKITETEISKIEYLNSKLFLASRVQNSIIIHEEGQPIDQFTPFGAQLFNIYSTKHFLVAHGMDGLDTQSCALLKFYDTAQKDRQIMKTSKYMLQVSKDVSMRDCVSFCVLDDVQAIALGFKDGNVLIFQSRQDKGNFSFKDQTLKPSNMPIRQLFFSRSDGNLNLFISTDDSIQCWHKCSKRVSLYQSGGSLFDITSRGTLIGFPRTDPSTIMEFAIDKYLNQNDIRLEEDKYEKQMVKSHLSNYLIILSKAGDESQLIIFDTLNQYTAHRQTFRSVLALSPSRDFIHLIYKSNRMENKLVYLKEKENAFKIEYFFKRSYFDVAWKFAKNQNSEPALLAEISRLHGDNLYTKSDYKEAIQKYIQTIGHIEPSYIIRKFLDVAHIDHLIMYLKELHEKKQADKHHTALLLNCFVKQKQVDSLDNFLQKESKYDVELFDIETAIKVCREQRKNDLALRLAEQKDQYEQYLEILLEIEKEGENFQAEKAINYIRLKVELRQKENFIMEFGQTLMKSHPEKCLELIKKIVILNSLRYETNIESESFRPSPLQKSALEFFDLTEKNCKEVSLDLQKEPDVFFHIFVHGNDVYLEKYLKFLIENMEHFKNNQKALLHRLFEYYLEKYHLEKLAAKANTSVQNIGLSGLSAKKDKKHQIIDLLKNQGHLQKCDKNHLLVLFKMYNFKQGIIHLYQDLKLKEELLNFYIMTNRGDKIIETCRGAANETNLWVQALKYFTHSDRFATPKLKTETEEKLKIILENIQNLNTLSPLLVLNILAKNKNVEFKIIKNFFIRKLEEDRAQIEKDRSIVDTNTKEAKDHREEYTKLKTQAKVFSQKNCSDCTNELTNPKVHFMCGHSYHDHCLHDEQTQKECQKCSDEFKLILDRKEEFDKLAGDSTTFFENIDQKENKFDTIATYLGKGLFNQSILAGKSNINL